MKKNISQLRIEIDNIDLKLVHLLAKRFVLSREIGKLKMENKIVVLDKNRERKVLEAIKRISEKEGIDHMFTKKLWVLILKQSRNEQKSV